MTQALDVVIRGGTVVDGSGGEPYRADVGIVGDTISVVGKIDDVGRVEVDATGQFVTPGFIDPHTHYDAQVTWSHSLRPSTYHGVTTVVMGNCGVGFAPCKPQHRDILVTLMEGIEDIPEIVMTEGMPWQWETFPNYLDFIGARAFDADVAAYLPHAALRVYVMGERAKASEKATEQDLAQMTAIVAEAVRAGAIGVSTSRNLMHRGSDGNMAPHVQSDRDELLALARGLKEAGRGVFQIIPQMIDHAAQHQVAVEGQPQFVARELALFREIAQTSGGPVTFSLTDAAWAPGIYTHALEESARVNAEHGTQIRPQIFPRPIGMLIGLDLSVHPFMYHPTYLRIKDLPVDERVAILRRPETRKQLLSEEPDTTTAGAKGAAYVSIALEGYRLGNPPRYTLGPDRSLRAEAERRNVSLFEVALDWLLDGDGTTMYLAPGGNVGSETLENVAEMLHDPNAIVGLGDGGAHYGSVCDAGFPTTLLGYWVRDRQGEGQIPLGKAINMLSRRNAELFGFMDRGLIAPGMRADLNIIDLDRIDAQMPEVVRDLPADGRRITQRAVGYTATMLRGTFTHRGDVPTGATPGGLVRSAFVDAL
ncbi:N-acyl-D-amino-acid deacylase family protein [Sphingobium subterraneum]|uniref:N-acyl-D-aspartate/D-glutamate deacylase n=1 Tax=Sphingobium subterraneum TaxID=627688 RepID=A0A841J047_9SPHN|nr:amidohydrolase family protein [Sphingobium subterraneum]MBB6124217.1 N-acyl-D-aspartate/D-glutamate deacylase [Sphingobium subterraneum]